MTTTAVHRLVAKAAKEWTELAASHGVAATVEDYESKYYPGGVVVTFQTGAHEHASVVILPPSAKGATVRQLPVISRHYRGRGGRTVYGNKPGTTLRDLRARIAWSWSPTASWRLQEQADRADARKLVTA